MSSQNYKTPRCEYPNCSRRTMDDGHRHCPHHRDPANWHRCECGAVIGETSQACQTCAAAKNAISGSVGISPGQKRANIKELAVTSRRWLAMTDFQREMTMLAARDTVACGVLTDAGSRKAYSDAWAALDAAGSPHDETSKEEEAV